MATDHKRLGELIAIAQEFRPGQFRIRAGGEVIECMHCDERRLASAGFYRDNHEETCPTRRLIDWFNRYVTD